MRVSSIRWRRPGVRRAPHYLARRSLFNHQALKNFAQRGLRPWIGTGSPGKEFRASIDCLKADKALLVFTEGGPDSRARCCQFKPGIGMVLNRAPATIVAGRRAEPLRGLSSRSTGAEPVAFFWKPTGGQRSAASVGSRYRSGTLSPTGRAEEMLEDCSTGFSTGARAEKLVRKKQETQAPAFRGGAEICESPWSRVVIVVFRASV